MQQTNDILVAKILSNLPFKYQQNCNHFFLEGGLDYDFYCRKLSLGDNNKFFSITWVVKNIIASEYIFKGKPQPQFDFKNKRLILDLISRTPLLSNYKFYAIIDRDADREYPHPLQPNIFSDNAHDLEMMLLFSDRNLPIRININSNIANNAAFMSYQLALLGSIFSTHFTLNDQDYPSIFNGNMLSTEKFYKRFNKKICNINKKICSYSTFVNYCRKQSILNGQGEFLIEASDFDFEKKLPNDFFQIVNGHDFCQFCCIQIGKGIGDRLETLLIDNYDNSKFTNTTLYKKLTTRNLLKIN